MKNKWTVFFCVLLLTVVVSVAASFTAAASEAGGAIYACTPIMEDTVWAGNGQIYYISAKLTPDGRTVISEFSVEPGATLTIEPGAIVYMNYNADYIARNDSERIRWLTKMNVYGSIIADGVLFTDSEKYYNAPEKDCGWDGIYLISGKGNDGRTETSASGTFKNCRFTDGGCNGGRGFSYTDGMITIVNGKYDDTVPQTVKLSLTDCTFAGYDFQNGHYGSAICDHFFPKCNSSFLTFSAVGCTFGSESAPVSGAFFAKDSFDGLSVSFDCCTLYSHCAAPGDYHFIEIPDSQSFTMKNCTVDIASPAAFPYVNLYRLPDLHLANNDISLVLDHGYYSDGRYYPSEILSGQPIRKLELKNGTIMSLSRVQTFIDYVTENRPFELIIARNGNLTISEDSVLKASYDTSIYYPNSQITVEKGAVVTGGELYGTDGTTLDSSTSDLRRHYVLNPQSKWVLESSQSSDTIDVLIPQHKIPVGTDRILLAAFKGGKMVELKMADIPANKIWMDTLLSVSDGKEPDSFRVFFINSAFSPAGAFAEISP